MCLAEKDEKINYIFYFWAFCVSIVIEWVFILHSVFVPVDVVGAVAVVLVLSMAIYQMMPTLAPRLNN